MLNGTLASIAMELHWVDVSMIAKMKLNAKMLAWTFSKPSNSIALARSEHESQSVLKQSSATLTDLTDSVRDHRLF